MKELQGPLYEHDCKTCVYLGTFTVEGTENDLYYCPQNGLPTVIARFSSVSCDYQSGMHSSLPELQEAMRRASARKLIPNRNLRTTEKKS